MTNKVKGNFLKTIAVIIDVGAPLAATLTQFPVWVGRSSEATFSGIFILFAFISCLPFIKYIKAFLRSPAIWVVWLVLFVFMFALSNIITEMIVVSFVGLVSNCIGAVLYKIGSLIAAKQ